MRQGIHSALLLAASLLCWQAPDPGAQETEEVLGAAAEIAPQAGTELVRIAAGTRLLRGPDPGSSVLAILDAGLELPVLERRDGWLRVRYADWKGWIPDPATRPELSGAADRPARRLDRARELLDLAPGQASSWLGPFELHTDLGDRELLESLGRIAGALPDTFRRRYGLEAAAGADAVVLFAHEADYRAFAADLGAGTDRRPLGHARHGLAVLFAGTQSGEEVAAVLVHELTHLLTRRALTAAPPPWLDEGMANDLSFCRVGSSGRLRLGTLGGRSVVTEEAAYRPGGWLDVDRRAQLSGPAASLSLLRERWRAGAPPSLAVLAGLSPGGFFAAEDRQLRYDASTFFVRYLLAAEGGRLAPRFRAFLAGLAAGGAAEPSALLAHLERGWSELERGFGAWLEDREP